VAEHELEDSVSISDKEKEIFVLATVSALGPTQPPIKLVPGGISQGVKRPGNGADHSPAS